MSPSGSDLNLAEMVREFAYTRDLPRLDYDEILGEPSVR
jgi:hypothetical protein